MDVLHEIEHVLAVHDGRDFLSYLGRHLASDSPVHLSLKFCCVRR